MADEGLAAGLSSTVAKPWPQQDEATRQYLEQLGRMTATNRSIQPGGPPTTRVPVRPQQPDAAAAPAAPPVMPSLGEDLSRSTVLPPQPPAAQPQLNAPFGELKASPPAAPTQRITAGLQDLLSAGGADTYNARTMAEKLMGLVQASPLAVPLAAADTLHYKSQDDIGGTALAAAGMIPGAKPAAMAAKKVVQEAAPAAKGAAEQLGLAAGKLKAPKTTGEVAAEAAVPAVAERYPATLPPVEAIDKKRGTPYLEKALSPEAETVSKARIAAQRDINAGNYTPHFDPAKRFDVDPANYPPVTSTLDQVMKKPDTRAKYDAVTMGPESKGRLDEAYQRGMKQEGDAGNWYQMGQLEREFIKEYGPAEGPRQFKEKFADAMAATTGGADPTSNLMMAHYGNYLRAKGEALPAKSYDYPFPVGGRYAGTNMEQYRKMLMEGAGVTPANPKRYNFSANFQGNRAGATIDEQMMGLIEPGKANPPTGAYGHYEAPVAERAAAAGVDPRFYQEVAWAGAKDAKTKGGFAAKPMIGIVNEAIERTHRITGMPREEIVRRGLVRSEIPLYGLGASLGGLAVGQGAVNGGEAQNNDDRS
jgi:hypothetical protein